VALIILGAIFGGNEDGSSSNGGSVGNTNTQNYIGEWVQGRHFKVAVLDVSERNSGPVEYMCEAAPTGSRYVMVNIRIENTDTESRSLLTEGEIHVSFDGKAIEYDQTETCTLGQEGFLNFMDDLGPFVTKEGRITFVIPNRFPISDMVFLTPRDEERINLRSRPADS
jgi:hypothetical protein